SRPGRPPAPDRRAPDARSPRRSPTAAPAGARHRPGASPPSTASAFEHFMNFTARSQQAASRHASVVYSDRRAKDQETAMRFVGSDEIRRVLTFPILVAAMEASHRGTRIGIHDMLMGEEKALYFVRSAADHGRAFGSKLFTSFPGNLAARNGLPAVQG